MFDPTPEPTETERFCIDSEERADWLLRKLANVRAEQARVKEYARKRTEELDADYNGLIGRFGQELETFARQEAERRRRQTITLPNGALAFTNVSARLVIGNQSDAVTTARATCPASLTTETVERFDSRAFLSFAERHFEETGELLPGIERQDAGQRFAVRIRDTKD